LGSQSLLRASARLIFGFGAVAVVFLALLPDLQLPKFLLWREHSDVIYHLSGFCVLTAAATMATNRYLLAVIAMMILASALEFLQVLVPGREVWLSDLAASLVGVMLGAVLPLMAIQTWRWYHQSLGH